MRKGSRFPVMELTISLFISLTVLAFAAPTIFRAISIDNLNSAALKTATDIGDTKYLAMGEGTLSRIDFTSGSYQVIRVSDNSVLKVGDLTNYDVATLMDLLPSIREDFHRQGLLFLATVLESKPSG